MPRRIVITGVGCITPVGNSVESAWRNVCDGVSGIGRITAFDASAFETQIAAEVKDFDPSALFGKKEARRMDRYTQFAVAATREALQSARLIQPFADPDRVGTIIGTGIGGMGSFLHEVEIFQKSGAARLSPFMIPMMLPDGAAGQVAIQFGARGPNLSIVSACATGSNAVGEASEVIRRGAADVMIAGGAEAAILPVILAGFSVMGALSKNNADPTHASRPFDKYRDGFIAGEGGAVIILEEWEHAKARQAPILAEFLGYGTTDDAYHVSAPREDGSGAALKYSAGIERSGDLPPKRGLHQRPWHRHPAQR